MAALTATLSAACRSQKPIEPSQPWPASSGHRNAHPSREGQLTGHCEQQLQLAAQGPEQAGPDCRQHLICRALRAGYGMVLQQQTSAS